MEDSTASSSSTSPAGFLDVASAAQLLRPGRWAMSNFHIATRCLKRNRRGFVTSPSGFVLRIFTKGLWSVTTLSVGHPIVKYFICSRPQATASASPSMAT